MAAPDAAAGLSTPAAATPDAATGDLRVDGSVFGSALVTGSGNTVTVVVAADLLRMRAALGLGGRLGANPYRGLDAFDETSHALFFGRERVVARLMQRLERATAPMVSVGGTRLVAVLGPSGCGKSSIALAGLLPALARTDAPWLRGALVVVLRPRASPVESLADALARGTGQDSASEVLQRDFAARLRAGGADAARQIVGEVAPSGRPLLLVVDQFEETYTLAQPADAVQQAAVRAERDVFVAALLAAAQAPGGQASVLLTLRSDFLGALAEHPALSAAVADGSELVPAMDRDELRRAVADPARTAGQPLPTHTVDRLLDEAEAGGGAALPLLSFALSRMWDAMRDGADPDDTLTRLGGVGGALALRADAVLGGLPKAAQGLARAAFMATAQLGEGGRDTRRRVALDDALPADAVAPARAALEPFVAERLLVADAAPDATADGRVWIELAHEALIRHWHTLRGWIDAERDDLRLERRALAAAAAWNAAGQPAGSLWRRPDLDRLRQLAARRGLPALAATFLARSVRRDRLVRQAIWAFAAMSLLLVAGGGFALYSARQSGIAAGKLFVARAELAVAQRNLAALQATLSEQATQRGDAMSGMLLALEAAAKPEAPDIPAARAALLDAWLGNREIADLHGGHGFIIGAAFTADGTRARVATFDGEMLEWGTAPPRLAAQATDLTLASNNGTFGFALSQDGSRAALAADDGGVHVFGQEGHIATIPPPPGSRIDRLAFNTDGRFLATGSRDGAIAVWRVEDRAGRPLFAFHLDGMNALALSADARRLAAAYRDGTIRLWDLSSSTAPPIVLRCQPGNLGTLGFAHDGQELFAISGNGVAQVWIHPTSGSAPRTLSGHAEPITDASFSPDGDRIVTASYDRTARVWDLADPSRTPVILLGHTAAVSHARFSPDGTRIVTSSEDGTARVWDVTSGPVRPGVVLAGHNGWLDDATFSADGSHVLTSGADGTARVWNVAGESAKALVFSGNYGSDGQGAAMSPDGRSLAVSLPDGSVMLRDLSRPAHPIVAELPGRGDPVLITRFSADGLMLLTVSAGRNVAVWSLAGAAPTLLGMVTPSLNGWIDSAAFSADGRHLLTTWSDARARIWALPNLDGNETVLAGRYGTFFGGWPMQAAFSADGHHVLTTWPERATWLWDLSRPSPSHEVLAESPSVAGASFGIDERQIAIGRFDGTTEVWQHSEGGAVLTHMLPGNGRGIAKVVFSGDGRRLATLAIGDEVRVWSLADESLKPVVLDSKDEGLADLDFSRDGMRLVVASAAGVVRLWDLSGSTPAASDLIPAGNGFLRVDSATFSADGRRVMAAGSDGLVRVFDTPPIAELEANARRALTRCLTIAQREAAGLPVTAAAGADRNAIPAPPCDAPPQ